MGVRKIFNYLGFFQDSRYGADTEFIYRAKIFHNRIKYNNSDDAIQYHANTLKNKNLTQIINWNKRRQYIQDAKNNISSNNYIEMAYLD